MPGLRESNCIETHVQITDRFFHALALGRHIRVGRSCGRQNLLQRLPFLLYISSCCVRGQMRVGFADLNLHNRRLWIHHPVRRSRATGSQQLIGNSVDDFLLCHPLLVLIGSICFGTILTCRRYSGLVIVLAACGVDCIYQCSHACFVASFIARPAVQNKLAGRIIKWRVH